jgi:hypothetical protein
MTALADEVVPGESTQQCRPGYKKAPPRRAAGLVGEDQDQRQADAGSRSAGAALAFRVLFEGPRRSAILSEQVSQQAA